MTKITQSDFESYTITTMEVPPIKTRAERVQEWKAAHRAEFQEASRACCICTPTRAQMLLVDKWNDEDID